jgi:RNA polymerase sigma factor (sigma-70 family)
MAQKLKDERKKREEFAVHYNQYYPIVYNTIFSKTRNSHDTRDICQEIFIILYEKLEEIQNIRQWLFGTIRYAALRYYERKSNSNVDIETLFEDENLSYVNGFKDARVIISGAIEKANLSDEDRMIFEYIAIYGFSYSNTGTIMGLSKRQIGYRYNDIVEEILRILASQGIHNIEDLL